MKSLRLIISLIYIFSVGIIINAQNVKSFVQPNNDISARTQAVITPNGDKCALVKVMLPIEDCSFDGDIESIQFKVNEYWVYLRPGATSLKIKLPAFKELNVVFSKISNISSLESGRTYHLSLNDYNDTSNNSVIVYFEILPKKISGTILQIDGKEYHVQDNVVKVLLTKGQHLYHVKNNNYLPLEGVIDVKGEEVIHHEIQLLKPNINGYEFVDLGLPSGLKWATCNIGASDIDEAGTYYAWGETSTKESFSEDNCHTWNDLNEIWLKKNSDKKSKKKKHSREYSDLSWEERHDISGIPEYDAASRNWGSTWRIPTLKEWEELLRVCKWESARYHWSSGWLVTGPNGNYIYLPNTGTISMNNGRTPWNKKLSYWSSTPSSTMSAFNTYGAYYLNQGKISKIS